MPTGICSITARGKEEVQEWVSPGPGEGSELLGLGVSGRAGWKVLSSNHAS